MLPGLVPSPRDTSGFSRYRLSPLPPYSRPPLRDARGPPASGSALNPLPPPAPRPVLSPGPRSRPPAPGGGGGPELTGSPGRGWAAAAAEHGSARLGAGLGTAPAPPRGGTAGAGLSPAPGALRGASRRGGEKGAAPGATSHFVQHPQQSAFIYLLICLFVYLQDATLRQAGGWGAVGGCGGVRGAVRSWRAALGGCGGLMGLWGGCGELWGAVGNCGGAVGGLWEP